MRGALVRVLVLKWRSAALAPGVGHENFLRKAPIRPWLHGGPQLSASDGSSWSTGLAIFTVARAVYPSCVQQAPIAPSYALGCPGVPENAQRGPLAVRGGPPCHPAIRPPGV